MNPFEISKPGFAFHEIHEKREEIFSKGGTYSSEDQDLLYRLRISELLWCLDEAFEYIQACKGGRARGFAEGIEAAAAIVAQHNLGPGGKGTTWHVRIVKRIMDLLPKKEANSE